jgi:FkbM family methyltransferase
LADSRKGQGKSSDKSHDEGAGMSALKGLSTRIRENIEDVTCFGPQFLLRHLPRFTRAKDAAVRIKGFGRMHLRPGESDVTVVRQIFAKREYDVSRMLGGTHVGAILNARYRSILDTGHTPTIVDAGANIGAATLWFRTMYPDAAIVAVEPEPHNISMLKKNLDGMDNVAILPAAIGSHAGFVEVTRDTYGWGAKTKRSQSGSVPTITMSDAFSHIRHGTPFIAKIDIEGFESEVFLDNLGWLDDIHMLLIEPHDWLFPGQRKSRSLQRAMASRDFEIFISGENLVYIRAER